MKILKGSPGRDTEARTFFESKSFRYELIPFYGALPGQFAYSPIATARCDKDDNLYLMTRNPAHPIVLLDSEGHYIKHFGQGLFGRLHSFFVTAENTLLCVDDTRHVVRELSADGELIRDIGNMDVPSDSGYDPHIWRKMQRKGDFVATDIEFNKPWAFAMAIDTIKRAAPPFNRPTGAAVSAKGNIYVSDGYGNAAIHKFTREGILIKTWGGHGREPGKFIVPHGIWVDRLCRVWVADREGNNVHIFSEDGELVGYIGENLYQPSEIWADNDFVYIGERGGGLTVADMELNIVAQLGYFNSPLRTHGLCGNSKGDLYILPLDSYDCHYLMKLQRM